MHDELKLEAVRAQAFEEAASAAERTVIVIGSPSEPLNASQEANLDGWNHACENIADRIRNLPRTLPPANTEADVERERLARCLEGYATGMDRFHRDIADDFRKAASIVRGAALSLTRTAGGEEVDLRQALAGLVRWADNVCRAHHLVPGGQKAVEAARAALTKPPALPKEREEAEVRHTLAMMLAAIPMYDGDDPRALHYQRQRSALEYALSSLPVRSGEVEKLLALADTIDGLIKPGGDDRVRLPSGEWLTGEGATAYLALVRLVRDGLRAALAADHE